MNLNINLMFQTCINFFYFFLLLFSRLMDSMDHLQASLQELANLLSESDHTFPIIEDSPILDSIPIEKRASAKKLLLKKSFYPYEWASSLEKLKKTEHLPPKEAFDSKLNQTSISESDYEFAKKVFSSFKCKNMQQYTELYCFLDTLLLAEIFTQYRVTILNEFGLDPAR